MGKFIEVSDTGVKTYTLFAKTTINKVIALQGILREYTFIPEDRSVQKEVYLDSANNLLKSAGVILSKSTENNKAQFKVEMERYQTGSKRNTLKRAEKVFIHEIGLRDTVKDHMFFLTDGIKQMFTTQFYIDLDNILKTVVPKYEMVSKKSHFKVFSGRGFKGEMIFEEISVKNFDTKRSNSFIMLTIKQISAKFDNKDFEDLTAKVEKYCREVLPTSDTKYEIAKRMTK